ncbi:MAG: N-6 DNA methylase [Candidatus Zixiibacteriota bacterium]
MIKLNKNTINPRYAVVPKEKASGATYTPKILSDFVAQRIIEIFSEYPVGFPLRVLDPAIGDGQLLVSLLNQLADSPKLNIKVHGFETNQKALNVAAGRLTQCFPTVDFYLEPKNFLDFVLDHFGIGDNGSLFSPTIPETYDLIIANPPYVRTQIMGARQAQKLSSRFCLSGRVDLYYAFILAMAEVLKPKGVAGIIVSNRFMTTRSGAPVRRALLQRLNICHIWDFGDSKLFNAAVLPTVLLAKGKNGHNPDRSDFTSIYETRLAPTSKASTPIEALSHTGVIRVGDGRKFLVQHGKLNTNGTLDGVWRIATKAVDSWLATVKAHKWGTFGDIGKIRVGVKTCADNVFIRTDWNDFPETERPELLKPLTTHHVARRFKALQSISHHQILYPHEMVHGIRHATDLSLYPRSLSYLARHRAQLVNRKYVLEAGREWYELWVPQDPTAWGHIKLVFRDIAEEPTFWIDQAGSVVNGDCYWIICRNPDQTDLLWLAAAVGNSRFIEQFYDSCFHNKLYAGRRRFITQYVENFPLPDPHNNIGKAIIAKAKEIYSCIPSAQADTLKQQVDRMVWRAFGLSVEEVTR